MKVYITKYALTRGILEADAELNPRFPTMVSTNLGHFHGKDWHETKEAAIYRAEEMRTKKIASLKKQIEKLEALKFD